MAEINYNIINVIDFLGLTQGIILGIVLIFSNRKNRPSLFLGLFLITFSIETLNVILNDTQLLEIYPNLLFLPIDFYFLSPVLLFLYAKSLIKDLTPKDYWLLLPGILEFTIFFILFCFPGSVKSKMIEIWDASLWSFFYLLIFTTFIIFFIIKTIQLIQKHQKRIGNYFSDIQNRELKWVKLIAFYQLAAFVLMIISIFFMNVVSDFSQQIFLSTLNVIFIYWVSLHGLRQSKVEIPKFSEHDLNLDKEAIENTNVSVKILPNEDLKNDLNDNLEDDFKKILKVIEDKHPYKNPELTLSDLGTLTQISDKKLSHLINQKAGINFSNFINQYRIEAAKKMLSNPEFNHLNMLGIGFEVGFNSKANFYTVFKKATNTTPAKFKKAQKSSI